MRQFIDIVVVVFSSFLVSIPMTGTTSSLHDKYTATTTPRDGMSRTASGSDINERTYSMFFPIERLAKVRFSDSDSTMIHTNTAYAIFNCVSFMQKNILPFDLILFFIFANLNL